MIKVPEFKEPGLTRWLVEFIRDRDRSRDNLLTKGTANHSVLLQSPANKVYEVTVDDAGVLHTRLIG